MEKFQNRIPRILYLEPFQLHITILGLAGYRILIVTIGMMVMEDIMMDGYLEMTELMLKAAMMILIYLTRLGGLRQVNG